MSLLERAHVAQPAAAAVETTWLTPEPKLWVGSQAGEFAGMIEFRQGHFLATDRLGASLGAHPTLESAKQRVGEPAPVVRPVLAQAALVTGVIATAVALMSLSLVHA
jgi:hypothetical protein